MLVLRKRSALLLVLCATALVVFVHPASARPSAHASGEWRASHGDFTLHTSKRRARTALRTRLRHPHHAARASLRHDSRRHTRAHRRSGHGSVARGAHSHRFLAERHRRFRIEMRERDRAAGGRIVRRHTGGAGEPRLVAEARRWIGGNPTSRRTLWCARFMNFVLERVGLRGTGSDMARSFASYGRRLRGPRIGAIAVLSRGRGGGHVGVISGIDARGNPIIVSGNHGNRVAEAPYSRARILAYVSPSG